VDLQNPMIDLAAGLAVGLVLLWVRDWHARKLKRAYEKGLQEGRELGSRDVARWHRVANEAERENNALRIRLSRVVAILTDEYNKPKT
jgi:hypothetical protein